MNNTKNIKKEYIRQFYKGNIVNLVFSMVEILIIVATNILISWLLQQVIDYSTGLTHTYTLFQLIMFSLVGVFATFISCALGYFFTTKFVKKAMYQYKTYVFEKISEKNISAFSGENTSLYISALSNDSNTIETDYVGSLRSILLNILLFVCSLIVMLIYNPFLTLISILLTCLPIAASILTGNKLANVEKIISEKNEGFMSTLKDSLVGFSVIKSFKAEIAICKLFSSSVNESETTKCQRRKVTYVIQCLAAMSGVIAQLGVFIISAWLAVYKGTISTGVIIVFVQLMNYLIQPISELPQLLGKRKAADALIEKLAIAISNNVRDEGEHIDRELNTSLALKNVSFGYNEGKQVLNNINVKFDAKKSYALVGASGSGKSTILNLLMGSYNNYSGEILIDGKELKNINSSSLYDMISIIQQNVFVFNNTIYNNITMFNEFPPKDVENAIKYSGLEELIAERGPNYLCGENGKLLSGGEKQRISIARSLLKKSSVLLVDEATASLDSKVANQVVNSILELKDITKIMITHNLDKSILEKFDSIVTLKNGNIEEIGSFNELMNNKGYFYSLYTVSQ